jgi:hypothetical protein
MPRRSLAAIVVAIVAASTIAPVGTEAASEPGSDPPSSAYEFLVQMGVLPVPALSSWELARAARCATPEAALEAGDCISVSGSGGGGQLRRTMW